MTTLFIANYSTQADLDCERDDSSIHEINLADFAAPQVASISLTGSDEWIEDLKEAAGNEVREAWEDDCPELVWGDTGWLEPTHPQGRKFRCLAGKWLGGDDDEVVVSIVIQQVKAEG